MSEPKWTIRETREGDFLVYRRSTKRYEVPTLNIAKSLIRKASPTVDTVIVIEPDGYRTKHSL